MALDGVDDLAMAPVLALHVDRDDGVRRGDEPQEREDEAQQDAGHDHQDVEDRRERLAVQQQRQGWQKYRQDVDHRRELRLLGVMWWQARRGAIRAHASEISANPGAKINPVPRP